MTISGKQVLAGIAVLVVAAVAARAIVLIGPPGEERSRRLDQRRVVDLTAVGSGVTAYWRAHGRLPASIDEAASESGIADAFPRDPVTGAPYGYGAIDDKSYELCAAFDLASNPGTGGQEWAHGAGRRCFRRTLPDLRIVP